MGKRSVEDIKRESAQLRGPISKELEEKTPNFSEEAYQLLKFHGSYQQDDRDVRRERKTEGKEPAYSMMARSSIPGGALTAEQYLVHDRAADDFGNGTIRITSRQGFQVHGILKGDLRAHIRAIVQSGLTTWNGCGDCVRNTMGTPTPLVSPAHRDAPELAAEIARTLKARSTAYTEIWIDGEKVELDRAPLVEEDIYGEVYLPRKFKIGIAIPPVNDVDLYTQDIGLAPHVGAKGVEGYTFVVGGGFGMTHNKQETYPTLAKPLCHAKRADVVEVVKAIVKVQRDFGNRENRRRARMKYTVEELGLERVKEEVAKRLPEGVEMLPPRDLHWETVGDMLGWHEQGDGNLFVGIWVEDGRIKDTPTVRWRSAFREIAQEIGCPVRLTPNTNLLFHDVTPEQRPRIEEILAKHGVMVGDDFTPAQQTAQACVALPTCGLALAESERYFPEVLEKLNGILGELGLEKEPLLVRMTGCPNGCARPYNADIAFVGRGPGRYAMYVGGSHRGDRLAGLFLHTVKDEEIESTVRDLLAQFKAERSDGETFTDWWGRTQPNGDAPHPSQFHEELAKRQKGAAAE